MRAILAPVGSAGDVHPFLGLGAALAERGHEVVVACNAHFAPLVRQLGFEFREVGTESGYRAVLADPRLWESIRGVRLVLRLSAEGLTGRLYEAIRACHEPGRSVIVGHSIAFGARVARDALGAPLTTVHLQPAIFRSLHETPVAAGGVDFSRWPRWF